MIELFLLTYFGVVFVLPILIILMIGFVLLETVNLVTKLTERKK